MCSQCKWSRIWVPDSSNTAIGSEHREGVIASHNCASVSLMSQESFPLTGQNPRPTEANGKVPIDGCRLWVRAVIMK